jgi:hypothetical protein
MAPPTRAMSAMVYKTGIDVANVYLPRKSGAFDYGYVNMNAPYQY